MPDYIMSGGDLAEKCVDVARNFKTIYMYACYGFQVTGATIKSKAEQNLNGWYTKANIAKLRAVANQHPPTWGFDCVNLIKGILWGWWGNPEKEKGSVRPCGCLGISAYTSVTGWRLNALRAGLTACR